MGDPKRLRSAPKGRHSQHPRPHRFSVALDYQELERIRKAGKEDGAHPSTWAREILLAATKRPAP